MKTHILIFGCSRDVPYLEYCLKSIRRFATGFSGVTVAVQIQEQDQFIKWAIEKEKEIPALKFVFYRAPEDREKHHIAHQAEKCRADYYVPEDTDFVFFMDSDCFFIEPVTPEDYITVEGKPILCIEEYAKMIERPWQEQTSRALGINAQWETMRRHGAVHLKCMFHEFRKEVERVHRVGFVDYVMSCKPTFCWGYSEFNALGNYVLTSHWKTQYQFVDVGVSGYPPDKMLDLWCHSPPEQAQPNRYRGKFPAEMTVRQIWEKLGLT